MHNRMTVMLAAATFGVASCGGSDAGSTPEANQGGTTAASATLPDACTFFTRTELETAIGRNLRDGEPQAVPDGDGTSCEFKRQLGKDATGGTTDPPFPASVEFSSATISISPIDPEAVEEIRQLDPAAFETVEGVGDDAYFLGPNLLHVRVGERSLALRINPDPRSPNAEAEVRKLVLALARVGAERL